MTDRYLAVKMPYGWVAYTDDTPGLPKDPDDMEFGSEDEMKLSMAALGYEFVSGDGVRFAQVWHRDSPGNFLETARGRGRTGKYLRTQPKEENTRK